MDTFRFVVEWVLPTLFALPALLFLREPREDGRSAGLLWRYRWPILVATRLLWPVALFAVAGVDNRHELASDLWNRRWRTDRFLEGGLPGTTYGNQHAPLLPWVEIVGRLLVPGRHFAGSLAVFILGDCLAVLCGARLAGRLRAWAGAWLLLTPALWHQTVVRGQDEALFTGLLAAALLTGARGRLAWTGAILGLGLAATKPTFAPYALAVLLVPGFRTRCAWTAFLGVVGGAYGANAALGASAVPDIHRHVENWGAGMGIPDSLVRLFPGFPLAAGAALCAAATVAALVASPLLLRRGPALERAIASVVLVHAALLLTLPCGVSPYFAQGLVPVVLFLGAPDGSRAARAARVLLPVAAWLCALHWTRSPLLGAAVKPVMIAFHGLLVWLVVRRGRAASAPDGDADAAGVVGQAP